MDLREEEIVALRTQLNQVLEEVNGRREWLDESPDNRLRDLGIIRTVNFTIRSYQKFVEPYNAIVEMRGLSSYSKMEGVEEREGEIEPARARGLCTKLKRNLKMGSNVLETLEDKNVETDKIARLSGLRESINSKLSDELPILSRNIQDAIDSLEDGHPKSASLVAGGVIDHSMDELKSELQVGDWNEAISELESRGVLDEEIEGRINRALKEDRNGLSHELDRNPDVEDALLTISATIQFLDKVKDIQDVDLKVEHVS